jgi:hypothetical protein
MFRGDNLPDIRLRYDLWKLRHMTSELETLVDEVISPGRKMNFINVEPTQLCLHFYGPQPQLTALQEHCTTES